MFKVGDKVVGKRRNGYTITNQCAIMVVTNVYSWGDMQVEVIKHKNLPDQIGNRFIVVNNSYNFRKAGAAFI